jgi:hypothetical protein
MSVTNMCVFAYGVAWCGCRLMERDSFPRFRKSDQYQQLVELVAALDKRARDNSRGANLLYSTLTRIFIGFMCSLQYFI